MRFVLALVALALYAGAATAEKLPWERACSSGCVKTSDISVSPLGNVYSAAGSEVLVSSDSGSSFTPVATPPSGGAKVGATAVHHKASLVLAISAEGTPGVHYSTDDGKSSSFVPLSLGNTGIPVAATPVVATADGSAQMAILTQDTAEDKTAIYVVEFPSGAAPTTKTIIGVKVPSGHVATGIAMPTNDHIHIVTTPAVSSALDDLATARPHLAAHYRSIRARFYGTESAAEAVARVGVDAANSDAGLRLSSADGGSTWESAAFELGAYTDVSCATEEICAATVIVDNANTAIEILRPGSEWRSGFIQGSAKLFSVQFALDEPKLAVASGHSITEDGRVLAMLISSQHGGLRWAPDLRDSGVDSFATARVTPNGKGGVATALSNGKVGVYIYSL